MYRRGHQGITLCAIAAVLHTFLPERPLIALLAAVGLWVVEPLPDKDQQYGMEHRGVSHSVFAAGIVGAVCAGIGWGLGTYVTQPLVELLFATPVDANQSPAMWVVARVAALDAGTLSIVGFWVGVGGILVHLLGDLLTPAGFQPLLPFSHWEYAGGPIPSESPAANTGLYVLGWIILLAALASLLGLDGLF